MKTLNTFVDYLLNSFRYIRCYICLMVIKNEYLRSAARKEGMPVARRTTGRRVGVDYSVVYVLSRRVIDLINLIHFVPYVASLEYIPSVGHPLDFNYYFM